MFPFLAGCTLLTDEFHAARVDADGDGAIAAAFGGADCDDGDAGIHPEAAEACDGIDEDCDGTIDDGVTLALYTDADGDGFGDADTVTEACSPGEGQVLDGSDCDDADALVSPTAREICNGIDDDCDGTLDEDQQIGATTFYRDADADGYGTDETIEACALPPGYATQAGDCEDGDPSVHPGAVEDCSNVIDLNCDGYAGTDDRDGDGFPACEECNDGNGAVNPDAVELCNDRDDDCDGDLDGAATDAGTWYADVDGDGWGAGEGTVACDTPGGFVSVTGDCDDDDAGVHPSADEDCASIVDANCDGSVGGADTDGDGHQACDECDDTDAAVFPGAREVCNGIDDDCSGEVDGDAVDRAVWYTDGDGDGYGSGEVLACTQPSGTSAVDGDCDDGDALVGLAMRWYLDGDGDGFGGEGYDACEGEVAVGGDCDDADATAFPGATEVCDGDDEDCDGTEDGAVDAVTWCEDADLDGYCGMVTLVQCDSPGGTWSDSSLSGDCDDADSSVSIAPTWCEDADLDGYCGTVTVIQCDSPGATWSDSNPDGDCDEWDAGVSPGAVEVCDDGVDQDCDGGAGDCGIVVSGTLAEADVSFVGETDHSCGYSVDSGEDLDGDLADDLILGCPFWSNPLGIALLMRGPPAEMSHPDYADGRLYASTSGYVGLGLALSGNFVLVPDWWWGMGSAVWVLSVEEATSGTVQLDAHPSVGRFDVDALELHPGVTGLADVDGDSVSEFAFTEQSSAGTVYLARGSSATSRGAADSAAAANISGDAANDHFGYDLAEIGDTNGDGLVELAVGAPYVDTTTGGGEGALYVFSGDVSGTLTASDAASVRTGADPSTYLGTTVSSAGDVDGDGAVDVIAGGNGGNGLVCLWLSPLSATGTTADAVTRISAVATSTAFGASASVGDVNGDEAPDLALGAFSESGGRGTVYLFLGAIEIGVLDTTHADSVLTGAADDSYAGYDLALDGDMNGDSFDDLLVGAPGGSGIVGGAYLFYGGWY